jgi:hypothetical protein
MRHVQMRSELRATVLAVGLLWAWWARAATYAARVVSITDGDTLHALYEGRSLSGFDGNARVEEGRLFHLTIPPALVSFVQIPPVVASYQPPCS